ncbi:MAG: 5-bromo-4-chloroindolyl phosphate hydrolysis family protein [Thermomicrobiales bacterium]
MGGILRWIVVALIVLAAVFAAGPSLVWLPIPLFGLGLMLLIPAFVLCVLLSPIVVVALIVKALLTRPRAQLQRAAPSSLPNELAVDRAPKQPTPSQDAGPLGKILAEAESKVDAMRTNARRIPKPAVRAQALEICAIVDRILAILPETADERHARDIVTRYFAPAETILSRYARLATRGVVSAGPALARVEDEDLPLIERKLSDLYDRLHRGDLIDLEVAREMLDFDFATAGPTTARA